MKEHWACFSCMFWCAFLHLSDQHKRIRFCTGMPKNTSLCTGHPSSRESIVQNAPKPQERCLVLQQPSSRIGGSRCCTTAFRWTFWSETFLLPGLQGLSDQWLKLGWLKKEYGFWSHNGDWYLLITCCHRLAFNWVQLNSSYVFDLKLDVQISNCTYPFSSKGIKVGTCI